MDTPNSNCTYSFGDNGTTATVGPSGRLLRISQHFRGEKVGYCVDHQSIPQPYEVIDRINTFLSSADDPDHNIGFYLDPEWLGDGVGKPSTTFIDDRWPVFTINTDKANVEIQYSISNGVVYQIFHFAYDQPPMGLRTDLLIRQLEFADRDNAFNKAEPKDDGYNTELSSDGHHIRRWHGMEEDDKQVVLFISAYMGSPLAFTEGAQNGGENEEQVYYMVWPENITTGSVEITFVYSLKSINDKSIKSPLGTVLAPVLRDPSRIHISGDDNFTESPRLNEILKRNLEHILSVCSIPVYTDTNDDNKPAIALTCGDIDNHRVATAASFYCFQLLLLALKHFEISSHHTEGPCAEAKWCYTCSMVSRIRKVLNGHLKWIFGSEYRNLASNIKCPHTWVNGKEIDGWEKNPYFPESLVDVPFQLIMAGDFYDYDKSYRARKITKDRCIVPKTVGRAIRAWVEELDTKNKLGCYAFPRNMEAPIHHFYLTDHVLIWRATKSVESLGLENYLFVDRTVDQNVGERQSRKGSSKRYYWPSIVQSQILKRFTGENPVSKKRMLSVSRSPSHICFLFRNKDASLFHAMDAGLFDKPGATVPTAEDVWSNKLDTWKGLVDCQRLHEDNDDTTWDEPLRFALSMIKAQKGKSMNSLSPKEIHGRATSVLLSSVWSNSLFPGQLDINDEPTIYADERKRDTYWGSTFEIPYILWKYAQPPEDPTFAAGTVKHQSSPMTTLEAEFWISLKALIENQSDRNVVSKTSTGPMKISFPWNNFVDQSNVVQLSDEWLYNLPDYFKADAEQVNEEEIERAFDMISSLGDEFFDKYVKGVVINVPRSRPGKKEPPRLDDMCQIAKDRSHLRRLIIERRLPNVSKKRLYASFASDRNEQRPYPQIRGESEAILSFFSKHTANDKSFFENTTAEKNRWTTELHLSFYALDTKLCSIMADIITKSPCDDYTADWLLDKGTIGCRFDGDLIDRYWTVYFLESGRHARELDAEKAEAIVKNTLRNQREEGSVGFTTLDLDALGENKEPWRQRRILELLLFQRTMDQMRHYTVETLNHVTSNVWKPSKTEPRAMATPGTHEALTVPQAAPRRVSSFQNFSQRCQLYQHILHKVEQDLAENLVAIDLWLNRERERQNEPPRWTFNDEIKYRTIISKLVIQNNRSVQEIQRIHANISHFKDFLTLELERMRNEADQRREDNIKRFTYVTVIFLPLSFGTGVFSMSNAPSGQTLESMIKTSAVAFGATIVLLVFSGQLESLFRSASRLLSDLYHVRLSRWFWKVGHFFRSFFARWSWYKKRDEEAGLRSTQSES
uniref:Mg2+ transporter zinc transport protein n=1 Tax=Gibberella zeae TaxID=5518 RepID=A0A4E9E822_GIBZA